MTERRLYVHAEIMGQPVLVGYIEKDMESRPRFRYAPEFLGSSCAAPISVSLPLREEAFSTEQTRNFFEGLLPEGFTRKTVAQHFRVDSEDYLSILHGLGRECLGALMIRAKEDLDESSYEKLSMDQVHALAAEGASKSAELVVKAHVSLTGASGKAGLYLDSSTGTWYLPKGLAPGTHIVKQSHIRLDGIVTNEQLCLMTARKLGIRVPDCFIINIEGKEDGDVLFASARYDRVINDSCRKIDGLVSPLRLHQEDFSQAMGIAAGDKYERLGAHYFRRMFDTLRLYSARPLEDELALFDTVVFDYLIGNTDNHIKNMSLLYSPDLKSLRLAPSYDILSTAVYESSTREMGFSIGGKLLLDEISRDSFRSAAHEIGLGEKTAMQHFDRMAEKFEAALNTSAEELMNLGFVKADPIRQSILKNAGYALL